MTRKGILVTALFVVCLISVAVVGAVLGYLGYPGGPIIGALSAILLGALVSLGAILFKPFRERLEDFVEENIRLEQSKCRIVVYGLPRSGKTTIIARILTKDKPSAQESTTEFDVYEETLRLGLKNPARYAVALADYKGQKPSQLIVDPPEKFFGGAGQRLVNAIFFVVDLFSELKGTQGKALNDEELLAQYKTEAGRQIGERVEANLKYLNEWSIESVFTLAYSERNLFAVRLLINKLDLLREVVFRGYLPEVNAESVEQYAKNLYQAAEKSIREACDENQIQDFSVHVISAATARNIGEMFSEILEMYSRKVK